MPFNIVTVIQARTGSSRFPCKVLLPLEDKPLLVRMVERVMRSRYRGRVVVATTTLQEDNIIESICDRENILCFRGHPTDLLDRHYRAALKFKARAVIKIPSDCPLIDPGVIDKTILHFIRNHGKYDYVSNLHPATYPDGNDVEIMTVSALQRACKNACRPFEREHTTPYIWNNRNLFRTGNIEWETGLNYSSSHRFTIDYPEDYELIKKIYNDLYCFNPAFRLNDILELFEHNEDLLKINSRYTGTFWHQQVPELNDRNIYNT